MLSGPVELLLEALDLACEACVVEICREMGVSALVCLSTFLLMLLVACFVLLTNCLLKALAFSSAVMVGLALNVMMVFGCEGMVFPFK